MDSIVLINLIVLLNRDGGKPRGGALEISKAYIVVDASEKPLSGWLCIL